MVFGSGRDDPLRGWLEVATAAASAAVNLPATLHGTRLAVALITAVADVRNNASLLESIKADTTALRNAPFKHGLDELELAKYLAPSNPRWAYHVRAAESSLRKSLPLARDYRETAVIEFYLTVANIALGQKDEAHYHIDRARKAADIIVNTYAHRAEYVISDSRGMKPKTPGIKKIWDSPVWGVAIFASGGTFLLWGGAVTKAVGVKARADLRDFLGFYNLIQHTGAAVGGADFGARYIALSGPNKTKGMSKYSLGSTPVPSIPQPE
jgi:hypothetical protein